MDTRGNCEIRRLNRYNKGLQLHGEHAAERNKWTFIFLIKVEHKLMSGWPVIKPVIMLLMKNHDKINAATSTIRTCQQVGG